MTAHTVALSIDEGRLVAKITCPFDRNDRERPCWARLIDAPDFLDPDGERYCNYEDWLDGAGEEILHGDLGTFALRAEWVSPDGLVLHIVAPVKDGEQK